MMKILLRLTVLMMMMIIIMTTMMLTAINKCNWLQLEIVGRRFMVECKLKTS